MSIDLSKIFATDGFPVLGWVVHYSVTDLKIKHADICTKLAESGIDPSIAPAIRPETAFRKTFHDLSKGHGQKKFARAIGTEAGQLYYGVVAQEGDVADLSQEADFVTPTKGRIDKTTKNAEFAGENAMEAEAIYRDRLSIYSSEQIRSGIVLRYLQTECQCFSVRRDGGLYFVALDKQSELEKLQVFFEKIGAVLSVIPIIDTATAKDSLGRSSYEDLKQELVELVKEMEKIDGDKIRQRDRIAQNKFEKFQVLKQKIEAYEALLSFSAEDLKSTLESLTETVKKKILKI